MKRHCHRLLALVLIVSGPGSALAQAPANDQFANAAAITAPLPVSLSATNVGATMETGEPAHDNSTTNASVWWRWTAPASGTFSLNTIGSNFDTVLAVYTGSTLAALTRIASDDEGGTNGTSSLQFTAVPGTTYYFAVAGWDKEPPGNISLSLSQAQPPANDNWGAAGLLPPALPSLLNLINLTQATAEPTEPAGTFFGQTRTVWWKWTPASNQSVIIEARSGFNFGDVNVFTGNALATLSPASTGFRSGNAYILSAAAGTVYSIRAAFYSFSSDTGTFSLRAWNPPANDNWAAAATLPGTLPASASGTQADAITETGEPNINPGTRTIWWKWTAPSAGPIQVITDPYNTNPNSAGSYQASVDVFRGATLPTLTALTPAFNYPNFGAFIAEAGVTYFIRVSSSSFNDASPSVLVSLQAGPPPPANDNFASAAVLTGLPSDSATGTIASAGRQTGEPGTQQGSIWYKWVATATGKAGLVMNALDDYVTSASVQVFTGAAVESLTAATTSGATQFNTVAGTTYFLQVSGNQLDVTGGPVLVQIVPVPGNDNFASATVLPSSLPRTTTGTTAGAGAEAGESPNERNVWYQWAAPVTGPVTLTYLSEVGGYSSVSVFTGPALTALTGVLPGVDGVGRFNAVSGTNYKIKVSSYTATGPFQFNLSLPPANDAFASNVIIPAGARATVTGDLLGSNVEDLEPGSGIQTLWWRWTAASTGPVSLVAAIAAPDTVAQLNVWEGATLADLTGIFGRRGKVDFDAVAGKTYRIQAGSRNPVITGSTLTLSLFTAPANDGFLAAAPLTGSGPLTATGWNHAASNETDEPLRGLNFVRPPHSSVWWKWTAPNSNLVVIDTAGSSFDTVLHVYQGAAINALNLIRASDEAAPDHTSRVAFTPQAGVTYQIRVSGTAAARTGEITLHLQQYPAPTTAAGHLLHGRASLEGGTGPDIAAADDSFAAALTLAPANQEAQVLRAITRLGRLQQQTGFTTLLGQWGFTTKRATLVNPRYLAPRTAGGISNAPPTANTEQARAFANDTLFPELALFESALGAVSGPAFSLPMTDSETCLRYLAMDSADLRILRAAGFFVKALVHTANTFDTGVPVQTLLNLHDGKDLNAESLIDVAASFLNRRAPDERAAAKAAFKSANSLYQPAYTAMQNRLPSAAHPAFLFYIEEAETASLMEQTEDANDAALSFDGPVTWDGTTVNLSALVTTPATLRSLLPKLKWNKAVASSAPDPTFAGALPGGTQAIANQFLKNNHLLHDVSSYLAWMENYLGDHAAEDQAPGADPDGDGFDNFTEYVFSLNPDAFSRSEEFETSGLMANPANGNLPHFTYSFIRLKSPAAVNYQVLVSDNLTTWDSTGAQLETAAPPVTQPDGVSEQVTLRLKQPSSVASNKYVKIRATAAP